MFDYDLASEKAAETLDAYDLSELLLQCYDVGWVDPWDIRERAILVKHPELADVLDELSTDEFMEYLTKRYNVRFEEVISYRMWLMKGDSK
jgi:hypothetical protein